jgi:hypothetical protein
LLVVAPDSAVARWCAEPIPIGNGAVLTPTVLFAETVPLVTDSGFARAHPELAVLSAQAHGKGETTRAVAVARASLHGVETLHGERAVVYWLFHESRGSVKARGAAPDTVLAA